MLTSFAMILAACSGMTDRVSDHRDPFTEHLLMGMTSRNTDLKSFKGLGRIRFTYRGRLHSARLLWVGEHPQQLRLMLRDVSGVPLVSLADNGTHLYIRAYNDDAYFKMKPSGTSLKRYLSVPVTADDIYTLLAGRIPVADHSRHQWQPDPDDPGQVLVLRSRWGRIVQKLYFDRQRTRVRMLERYGPTGEVQLRLILEDVRMIDAFQIPMRFQIVNPAGDAVWVTVERYWANPAVAPSTFVLSAPAES